MGLFRKKKYEIGILFNIDTLGGGFYGREAYKILFESLDPQQVRGCLLFDGDINATLAGHARLYCIAIQATDPQKIDYIRSALANRTDKGLLGPRRRFVEGKITGEEPLVLAGGVDQAGVLAVWEDDMVQATWTEGTAWRVVTMSRP